MQLIPLSKLVALIIASTAVGSATAHTGRHELLGVIAHFFQDPVHLTTAGITLTAVVVVVGLLIHRQGRQDET